MNKIVILEVDSSEIISPYKEVRRKGTVKYETSIFNVSGLMVLICPEMANENFVRGR